MDVVGAVRGVKFFFRIMGKLKESSEIVFSTGRVKNFFNNLISDNEYDNLIYQEVELTYVDAAKLSLKAANDDILCDILQCFNERFDRANTDNLFCALVKILDTEVYLCEELDDAYGTEEVNVVADQFCDLPNANGCDVTKIEREWAELKQLVVTTGLKNKVC